MIADATDVTQAVLYTFSPSGEAMKDQAGRYRKIAADIRAKADTSSNEPSRNAMLAAPDIWDRLAALAEQLPFSAALSQINAWPREHSL